MVGARVDVEEKVADAAAVAAAAAVNEGAAVADEDSVPNAQDEESMGGWLARFIPQVGDFCVPILSLSFACNRAHLPSSPSSSYFTFLPTGRTSLRLCDDCHLHQRESSHRCLSTSPLALQSHPIRLAGDLHLALLRDTVDVVEVRR